MRIRDGKHSVPGWKTFGAGKENIWIRDPGWIKIRIRDKHPESATLPVRLKLRKSHS
jgi:hypothetical protein